MVTIYTCSSHIPSRKAIEWFENHGLEYTERRVTAGNFLSEDEIMKMLRMVDDVYDLISKESKIYKNFSMRIETMKIKKQLVPFLQKNMEVVNFPIIMSNHVISTGFRERELKRFLPKSKRIQLLQELVEAAEKQNNDPGFFN